MKKLFYSALGLSMIGLNYVNAGNSDPFGEGKVDPSLTGPGPGQTADQSIQTIIGNAIGFLYLVAVVYALWGGFLMLTAGGKDDQMKKGRTVITQALIGLVVIWLANSIVSWLVNNILGA